MKRGARIALAVLALGVIVGGLGWWANSHRAPYAVAAAWDRIYAAATGVDPITRCFLVQKRTANDDRVIGVIPERQCYAFDPPQRFVGIYIDEFGGQLFLPDVAPARRYYEPVERIWPKFERGVDRGPLGVNRNPAYSRIWQVDLIGRKTSHRTPYGYGHMGASQQMIVVDKVKAARLLATFEGYTPENVLIRR